MADNESDDHELAPMVDGLSGALCIFILITTIFVMGGIDTIVTGGGGHFTSQPSRVDLTGSLIYFDRVVSLTDGDYQKIKEEILLSGKQQLIIEGFTSDGGSSIQMQRALVYNLLEFKKNLSIDKLKISLSIATQKKCDNAQFCIEWRVE